MSDLDAFVAGAEAMAEAVRPGLRKAFADGLGFEKKDDLSPVTVADRAAEAAIRAIVAERWPDHGVYGEEYGSDRADAERVWVIDPIDGTKSFVSGKPLFGSLIALLRHGRPEVGVIELPALDERFVGAAGRASTWNGRPIATRRCASLDQAWLYATTPEMFEGANAQSWARLRARVYTAVYGADLYAYGLLARGRIDLVCEAQLKPYDYCAVIPVVEGAGGVITDWEGAPLGLSSDGRVLAAGDPAIHRRALDALAGG